MDKPGPPKNCTSKAKQGPQAALPSASLLHKLSQHIRKLLTFTGHCGGFQQPLTNSRSFLESFQKHAKTSLTRRLVEREKKQPSQCLFLPQHGSEHSPTPPKDHQGRSSKSWGCPGSARSGVAAACTQSSTYQTLEVRSFKNRACVVCTGGAATPGARSTATSSTITAQSGWHLARQPIYTCMYIYIYIYTHIHF